MQPLSEHSGPRVGLAPALALPPASLHKTLPPSCVLRAQYKPVLHARFGGSAVCPSVHGAFQVGSGGYPGVHASDDVCYARLRATRASPSFAWVHEFRLILKRDREAEQKKKKNLCALVTSIAECFDRARQLTELRVSSLRLQRTSATWEQTHARRPVDIPLRAHSNAQAAFGLPDHEAKRV